MPINLYLFIIETKDILLYSLTLFKIDSLTYNSREYDLRKDGAKSTKRLITRCTYLWERVDPGMTSYEYYYIVLID